MRDHSATDGSFDKIITSSLRLGGEPVGNLAGLLFQPLAHRDEHSDVIISHDGPTLVRVSLARLRFIVSRLFSEFRKKGIQPGTTVLLAGVSGNNELFIALIFHALAAYGARVLLPMFMETGALKEWLELAGCTAVIVPEQDIGSLDHHDKEKSIVRTIQRIALGKGLPCYDSLGDFRLREWLYRDIPDAASFPEPDIVRAMDSTTLETGALLITTSGSSGKSKLVAYAQGAFIRSCLSWQKAGFYEPDKLGGRGFTPLFTHTMGIRAYFNALWTGSPLCLINTEWFEEKPETVRYFLLQMKPEHITGGPAVYNLLLELMRNFPELKNELKSSLKTVVLSGAPSSGKTARAVECAFGMVMHNAFGMTETQQVLSTLLFENAQEDDLKSLGRPLPGVTVGLKKMPENPGCYRLYVRSPFGSESVLGETPANPLPNGFLDTGDIVRLTDNGRLLYEGREAQDFLKDGFGVKIPLIPMTQYYAALYREASHIEFYPLKNSPGLAALVFLGEASVREGIVTEKRTVQEYSRRIAEINTQLFHKLEPFEFRHRVIRRFALVNGAVPRTVKGNVSKYEIEVGFRDTIDVLTDPQASQPGVEVSQDEPYALDTFTRFLNPYVGGMLSGLKMDTVYHRAKKDSLFTNEAGREIEVLDLVGGYGTNLLGHNHEELKAAAASFLNADEIPLADQGSIQKHAGRLAEELAATVGEITGRDYIALFGSSGSESVEMALHHAALEWRKKIEKMEQDELRQFGGDAGRRLSVLWEENRKILHEIPLKVITLKNAFHGNSSGPRSLLGNDEQRGMFRNITGLTRLVVDDQSPDWKEQLDRLLDSAKIKIPRVAAWEDTWHLEEFEVSTVIAAIAEPITGEGGVREVNPEFLTRLGQFEFPLIMDEIQCGLGRAGSFLASEGVKADYYLFGKALGGAIEKISALLIDKKRYQKDFAKYYVSTFANGGLAASVALKALSIIKSDGVPERALRQGARLFEKLAAIQKKFPSVIAEITGRGLMLGIKFNDFAKSDNILLRTSSGREISGYLFSSFLLRKFHIRVLPTLSAPNSLRIEPSAYITDEEIDRVARAVEDLARTLEGQQLYELCLPLMNGDPFEDNKGKGADPGLIHSRIDKPAGKAVRVAFIAHFSRPAEELRIIERDFSRASDTGLRILFNRLQALMEMKPLVLYSKNMFEGRIHFSFISLPMDSAELERLHRLGTIRPVVAKIQEAVELAARNGATVIGLGGYASILSRNGLALAEPEGARILTGNTLTAASGIYRLTEEIRKRQWVGKNLTLGIVGAAGNIGSIIAESLLRADGLFEKVILMDRKKAKLDAFAAGLNRGDFMGILETTTGFRPLKQCDIIAVSTNTNDPIIFPHHLKDRDPVLISDISIPSALATQVSRMDNVTTLPFASYITLRDDPEFVISSHTPKGTAFCCAAEVMLYGLEAMNVPLRGKISLEAIDVVTAQAKKHRFFEKLGSAESFKSVR